MNHCCFIPCDKEAYWVIQKEYSASPDDYTHACDAHVGPLLYDTYNKVYPIEGHEGG